MRHNSALWTLGLDCVPYHSLPHQQVSLHPHDYASISWLFEPKPTIISRQLSKSSREYITLFPEEKCSQENLNGTDFAQCGAAASKSPCPVVVCREPWLKLLEGTCMLILFPNASRSLRDHPCVLPVGYAKLTKLIQLASCFSRLYIFFRRSSYLYWKQQSCAFITPHVWRQAVQGPEIRLWATLGPKGAYSLFAVNGNQNWDSPAVCRDHLDNVKTVVEDPLIWKPVCIFCIFILQLHPGIPEGVTCARLIGISRCLKQSGYLSSSEHSANINGQSSQTIE